MTGHKKLERQLTVGEIAQRSGLAVSTLHFYEEKGLITSYRTPGNQRRYPRSILRRIAVIRIAQRAGISLGEISEAIATLPADRAPSVADWRRLSENWRDQLNERIVALVQLRDELDSCIGCGCLSLEECPLRNPRDEIGKKATGATFLRT